MIGCPLADSYCMDDWLSSGWQSLHGWLVVLWLTVIVWMIGCPLADSHCMDDWLSSGWQSLYGWLVVLWLTVIAWMSSCPLVDSHCMDDWLFSALRARELERAKRREYNQRYYKKLQQDPGRYERMRKQQAAYLKEKMAQRKHHHRPWKLEVNYSARHLSTPFRPLQDCSCGIFCRTSIGWFNSALSLVLSLKADFSCQTSVESFHHYSLGVESDIVLPFTGSLYSAHPPKLYLKADSEIFRSLFLKADNEISPRGDLFSPAR